MDLAKACLGQVVYDRKSDITYLFNLNGTVKSNLQLDCSSFVGSVYFTLGYDITRASDIQATKGQKVQNFKNSDGTINYNSLLLGDILFFDYNLTDDGTYNHVAIYIGGGQYIDVASGGCSINTSGSLPGADRSQINALGWTKPAKAAVHDMIVTARRIIN